MSKQAKHIAVVGHIGLDFHPHLNETKSTLETLLSPGQLVRIGPATLSLGGAVSNTGLALSRLGVPTRLIGKVGSDLFGDVIQSKLENAEAGLSQGLVFDPNASTSYTLVLSPPEQDRCFLHHPGANDSFSASELQPEQLDGCRILHFGYPPLMEAIFSDRGKGLAQVMRNAQSAGLLTSLDMAMPDPASPAGSIDWRQWLTEVLPAVDIIAPSLEEILFMLHRDQFEKLQNSEPAGVNATTVGESLLDQIAIELIDLGVKIAAIKLGDEGLFLRTSSQTDSLQHRSLWQAFDYSPWQNRQLLAPCFVVDSVGTCGAGDTTVAGLLASLMQELSPEAALSMATAVGAYCVENIDSTSNIPDWHTVESRIEKGWQRRPVAMQLTDWQESSHVGIYRGPHDCSQTASSPS